MIVPKLFLLVLLLFSTTGCGLAGDDADNDIDTVILIEESSDIDTSSVQLAPFNIDEKHITDDVLTLEITFSGGCKEHNFELYSTPPILYSNPPGTETYLIHDGNGDACRTLVHETLQYDISPVQDGERDVVIIGLHKNLASDVSTSIRYEY